VAGDESADPVCRLMYPVCALLAASFAGAGAVPAGLADLAAAALDWHLGRRGVRADQSRAVFTGTDTEVAVRGRL
jgi:hypothetical protein